MALKYNHKPYRYFITYNSFLIRKIYYNNYLQIYSYSNQKDKNIDPNKDYFGGLEKSIGVD